MFDFQPFSVHFSSCKDRIDPLFDFNLPQTSCITYAQNICHGLFNRGVNRAIWPCYNSLPSNKSSPFSIKRVLCVDLLFILVICLKQRMCLWEIWFFFQNNALVGYGTTKSVRYNKSLLWTKKSVYVSLILPSSCEIKIKVCGIWTYRLYTDCKCCIWNDASKDAAWYEGNNCTLLLSVYAIFNWGNCFQFPELVGSYTTGARSHLPFLRV